jgi:hypothetical protein
VADAERIVDDVYTTLLPVLLPVGVPMERAENGEQQGHP